MSDSTKKVISFTACTGMGMYDPIDVDIVLADGTSKSLTYNGHDSGNPVDFLERDGYIIDIPESNRKSWKWPK